MKNSEVKLIIYIDYEISDGEIRLIKDKLHLFFSEYKNSNFKILRETKGSWYIEILVNLPLLIAGGLISWIIGKSLETMITSINREQLSKVTNKDIETTNHEKYKSLIPSKHNSGIPENSNLFVSVRYSFKDSEGDKVHRLMAFHKEGPSEKQYDVISNKPTDVENANRHLITQIYPDIENN